MSYKFTGIVKVVGDVQAYGNNFEKREFVVADGEGKYPQEIKFECIQENISELDDVRAGDEVEVRFDLRGNEYKGRYFVNLIAWKVVVVGSASAESSGLSREPIIPTPGEPITCNDEEEEGVPF